MSLARSALYSLPVGLIAFPVKELDQLRDIGIHQVNAQHVAGLGPHPHDEIFRADTVDNQETAVVASNRERSGAILHTLTYHDTAYTGKTSMVYHLNLNYIAVYKGEVGVRAAQAR